MKLSLEEKEKLLKKAKDIYNEIIGINIRRQVKITNVYKKYYPYNDRYTYCEYDTSKQVYLFGENINKLINKLEEYIEKTKNNENYFTLFASDVDILLDLVYNKDTILETIKRTNEEERQTLNDLLN